MGYGDEIMGSGMARVAHAATGKRVAFGDGHTVNWSREAEIIYRNNLKVVRPSEKPGDWHWIKHHRHSRAYGTFNGSRLIFKTDFKAVHGEFFFDEDEITDAKRFPLGLVVIEPHVKVRAPNKQWSIKRYQEVAQALIDHGVYLAQFNYDNMGQIPPLLPGVKQIRARSFREAAAVLARAKLFIGAEGGLHHAAAAVGTDAVVIFGGYIHPSITGYPDHDNIFVGDKACGTMVVPCEHCESAMESITVERVLNSAVEKLNVFGKKTLKEDEYDEAGRRDLVAGL